MLWGIKLIQKERVSSSSFAASKKLNVSFCAICVSIYCNGVCFFPDAWWPSSLNLYVLSPSPFFCFCFCFLLCFPFKHFISLKLRFLNLSDLLHWCCFVWLTVFSTGYERFLVDLKRFSSYDIFPFFFSLFMKYMWRLLLFSRLKKMLFE